MYGDLVVSDGDVWTDILLQECVLCREEFFVDTQLLFTRMNGTDSRAVALSNGHTRTDWVNRFGAIEYVQSQNHVLVISNSEVLDTSRSRKLRAFDEPSETNFRKSDL